jgi:hypothetical protein
MPFRVAFDLDGTIADMQAALRAEAERLFDRSGAAERPASESVTDAGEPLVATPGEADATLQEREWTPRQQAQLWDRVSAIEDFWVGLPEMEPGIVARIAEMAAARRWDVIFFTTRPSVAGATVQKQTQQWIAAHGFALPSVFVVHRSRGKIAEALDLDAFVDDRPENSLDVALDSKAAAILIWPRGDEDGPPGAARVGVRLVRTISDALDLLVKLDDAKNGRSVVRSLRKLFGKETTV